MSSLLWLNCRIQKQFHKISCRCSYMSLSARDEMPLSLHNTRINVYTNITFYLKVQPNALHVTSEDA
jgi:hypothetical protein